MLNKTIINFQNCFTNHKRIAVRRPTTDSQAHETSPFGVLENHINIRFLSTPLSQQYHQSNALAWKIAKSTPLESFPLPK
jgi:hypothetical protein